MNPTTKIAAHYAGKKIFLTGHTGFKGSWFLALLHSLGAEVKGYALEPNINSLYDSIKGDILCESVIGDICDSKNLAHHITQFNPDYVFHFAAQSLVLESYKNTLNTFSVNAIGTANLLESVKQLKKPCQVIVITTDKVYQNNEWIYPYRETDRLGGFDPYSTSKACAELIVGSYRNSFFNPEKYTEHGISIATARAGNVIGGGDWSENRIIPDCVKALLKNEPINVRNPLSVRPWQHVLEALAGYLLLGAKMSENPHFCGEAWNFGPLNEDNLKVEDVVKITVRSWGQGNYSVQEQNNIHHEARLLKLDCSKAISYLDWKPKWNAQMAIQKTMEWYKATMQDASDCLEFTNHQINEYFE